MNNNANEVKKENEVNLDSFLSDDIFSDKNYKTDYLLSVRLSYTDNKKSDDVYSKYLDFLKSFNLLDDNKKIKKEIDTKKQGQYFFIFKKSDKYQSFFDTIQKLIDTNKNNKELKDKIEKLKSILDCKKDIEKINFTLSNYELKKDKIKNFINYCKKNNLIK